MPVRRLIGSSSDGSDEECTGVRTSNEQRKKQSPYSSGARVFFDQESMSHDDNHSELNHGDDLLFTLECVELWLCRRIKQTGKHTLSLLFVSYPIR